MTPDVQATITRLKELELESSPAPWGIEVPTCCDPVTEVVDSKGRLIFCPATGAEESLSASDTDLRLMVELRNAAPALISDYERKTRKLAIYEKRMAYLASNEPEMYQKVLANTPEQEN